MLLTATFVVYKIVCKLDYPFSRKGSLPSSLYTFAIIFGAWLGITMVLPL